MIFTTWYFKNYFGTNELSNVHCYVGKTEIENGKVLSDTGAKVDFRTLYYEKFQTYPK